LTETQGTGGNGKQPVVATATLTNAKQVTALAAYLNGLPVDLPGAVYSCPEMGHGGGIAVTFLTRSGGPPLAKATATVNGCAFLNYTMPGQSPTGLGGPLAGVNLLAEVNRVAGLHWKVP
jgi:hypothetical protein